MLSIRRARISYFIKKLHWEMDLPLRIAETTSNFEQFLAGNPNSSELWIQYMAFYPSDHDHAVADKALGGFPLLVNTLLTAFIQYGDYRKAIFDRRGCKDILKYILFTAFYNFNCG
jgi:hypothetical protein